MHRVAATGCTNERTSLWSCNIHNIWCTAASRTYQVQNVIICNMQIVEREANRRAFSWTLYSRVAKIWIFPRFLDRSFQTIQSRLSKFECTVRTIEMSIWVQPDSTDSKCINLAVPEFFIMIGRKKVHYLTVRLIISPPYCYGAYIRSIKLSLNLFQTANFQILTYLELFEVLDCNTSEEDISFLFEGQPG